MFILPGLCFGMSGFIRIVTCPPNEVIIDAFNRLKSFISKHRKTILFNDITNGNNSENSDRVIELLDNKNENGKRLLDKNSNEVIINNNKRNNLNNHS